MPLKPLKDKLSTSSRSPRRNPAIRYSSESIEEMSQEEILPRITELQVKGEPFEKIISFYIGKRKLTEIQTKKWLAKFNEFREERSLSSLPGDVETCSSSEIRNLRFPKETVSMFYSRLCCQSNWNMESTSTSKLPSRAKERQETSSDSNCEEEEGRKTRQSASRVRKGSWKEYKKTKDISDFLSQNTENPGVKKLIKMTIKELWKQKKSKNIKTGESKIIEVDKIEVADMIYEVTEHMTKKYLPMIKDLARKIDPATDRPDSECESGSYDSQDEFYPHREDKRSKLPKYAMAVGPDVLINHGLYEILLVTLPLCASYSDDEQLEEFIDILKEAKDSYIIPKGLTLRGTVEAGDKQNIKEKQKSKMIVFRAEVNASPSCDTLADILEIEDSKEVFAKDDEESDSASLKSVSADIREKLRRGTLQSIASEDSQSASVFDEMPSDSVDMDVYPEQEANKELSTGYESNLALPEDTSGQLKRDRSPKQEEKPSKKIN